jgi:hypothetical protein
MEYVEIIKSSGKIVNGTIDLNEQITTVLLNLIADNSSGKLHTEYGMFLIFESAYIRQDLLYIENNKLQMRNAEASYFVLADKKTWNEVKELHKC